MPTVNLYYKSGAHGLMDLVPSLKSLVAEQLSCFERSLSSEEISIRLICIEQKSSSIADVEIEITAHTYKERIERQDEICREIRGYILQQLPALKDVQVWLKLCELGHSWEV